MIEKNSKKMINAWCMYDWANSVYSLTITTAVFPSYYYGVTGGKDAMLKLFGAEFANTAIYSFTLAIAFLLVAAMNPILSSIADSGGYKKGFMKFFCYLGAVSCSLLYFFDSEHIQLGILFFALAGMGYAGSLVFYNSYLPEIVTEDQFDRVSARGYSWGYIGSVLLLIVNLVMILNKSWFGIAESDNVTMPKISFLTVGLWWFGFAQITFSTLPGNLYNKKITGSILGKGFQELAKVVKEVRHISLLKKYLLAFFFYSMGVQTVMYMATIFGEEVVKMEMSELILMVLLLNIIAIPGAYLFAKISDRFGNIISLAVAVAMWIGICIVAFFIGEGDIIPFYAVGVFVGLVMGGIQSMSRSTYSKFIPQETTDHASYFSFYETLEKTSIALGTFVFGLVRHLTGNMNTSALVLGLFFVAGLYFLLKIPSKQIYNTHVEDDGEVLNDLVTEKKI
jgi:MFS transporter, UMF1 family